jgi:hypothetical protein
MITHWSNAKGTLVIVTNTTVSIEDKGGEIARWEVGEFSAVVNAVCAALVHGGDEARSRINRPTVEGEKQDDG